MNFSDSCIQRIRIRIINNFALDAQNGIFAMQSIMVMSWFYGMVVLLEIVVCFTRFFDKLCHKRDINLELLFCYWKKYIWTDIKISICISYYCRPITLNNVKSSIDMFVVYIFLNNSIDVLQFIFVLQFRQMEDWFNCAIAL